MLFRSMGVFNGVSSANTDPTLQRVQEKIAPQLAAANDAIFLNSRLFKRVQAIYKERDRLKLSPESRRLIWYYHQQFVHAGAQLTGADRARLKKLNEEQATLSAKFMNQLLAGTQSAALVVSNQAQLAGLSQAELEAAAAAAKARDLKGKWVITLQNTTQQPLLSQLTDRATPQAAVRRVLEPHRARRPGRHPRHHRAHRAGTRAKGAAPRLSELRRLAADRPDGQIGRAHV